MRALLIVVFLFVSAFMRALLVVVFLLVSGFILLHLSESKPEPEGQATADGQAVATADADDKAASAALSDANAQLDALRAADWAQQNPPGVDITNKVITLDLAKRIKMGDPISKAQKLFSARGIIEIRRNGPAKIKRSFSWDGKYSSIVVDVDKDNKVVGWIVWPPSTDSGSSAYELDDNGTKEGYIDRVY